MADSNVPITAGTGTNIDTRTEATNGDHRQVVVIGDPSVTNGVALVDPAFGLEVDVSRIVPGVGATNLGKAEDSLHVDGDTGVLILGVRNHFTGSNTDGDYSAMSVSSTGDLHTVARKDHLRVSVAPTVSSASRATGTQIGSVMTLAVGRSIGVSGVGSGIITSAVWTESTTTATSEPVDIIFFKTTPTGNGGDGSSTLLGSGDVANILGVVQLTGAFSLTTGIRVSQAHNIAIPYETAAGSVNIFAIAVTRYAYTPSANAHSLIITVERN